MPLDITTETEEKMLKLEDTCVDELQKAVTAGETNDHVKQCKELLGVFAKNRQTMNNRDALRFAMVNSFADDETRQRYVAATQPIIGKLLEGKTNK